MNYRTSIPRFSFILVLIFNISICSVNAQVSTDGTVGAKTSLSGPKYQIGADLGKQAGSNLFHSFNTFNINTGESAAFTGPNSINNIISRVTGGTGSWIDGILSSEIAGANFWFLNPGGVMFGPNASLNISGSFHVSTADYLRLGEAGRFDAVNPENSVLTVAPPSAFGFLGENPAKISLEGSFLEVPEGEVLSVVGGNIRLHDSTLYARGGQVNMASAASSGEVEISENGPEMKGFEKQGEISISREAEHIKFTETSSYGDVEVSGIVEGHTGGAVFIRGGRIVMQGGAVVADNYGDESRGRGITIQAEKEILLEKSNLESASVHDGNAGDVNIETGKLTVNNGTIYTYSSKSGDAGNVRITADDINIIDSKLLAISLESGNAGDIGISANKISIGNGSQLEASTRGSGRGGNIDIKADESLYVTGSINGCSGPNASGNAGSISIASPSIEIDKSGEINNFAYGSGNAGEIYLQTNSLTILNGSSIDVSSYNGTGKAGNIRIDAANSINITGKDDEGQGSMIFANTLAGGGEGGNITLKTSELTLHDGSLQAATLGDGNAGTISLDVGTLNLTEGSQIITDTLGKGKGGNIAIKAGKSLNISGDGEKMSAIRANTSKNEDGGAGGNINIVSPSIVLNDNGSIQAITKGSGDAGQIIIETGSLKIKNSTIILSAMFESSGNAGDLTIKADKEIVISGYLKEAIPGGISGNVDAISNGGSITITTPSLILDEHGAIQVTTNGSGKAGDITLNVDNLRITGIGQILNTTGIDSSGNGGNITINAADSVYIEGFEPGDSDLTKSSTVSSRTQGRGTGGNITIETASLIMDNNGIIENSTSGSGSAGTIKLDAGNIRLTGGANIQIMSNGEGNGGLLKIKADTAYMSGFFDYSDKQRYGSGLQANTQGSGNAGEIYFEVGTLTMEDAAQITAASRKGGEGNAGNIKIIAKDSISISHGRENSDTAILSDTEGKGEGGNISINTPLLKLDYGAITSETAGNGNAGNIKIQVERLELTNGSQIHTDTKSSGNGALLEIIAGESVYIAGSADGKKHSALLCGTKGDGSGGQITIDAPSLVVDSNGKISVSTDGTGDAGKIVINVNHIKLNNYGEIQAITRSDGKGGDIEINKSESVVMENDGGISSSNENGDGKPGNITINTGHLNLAGGSQIQTVTAGKKDGGNINVNAKQSITIFGKDNDGYSSGFFVDTVKETGGGKGGNITINSPELILDKGTTIRSRTKGSGDAGEIKAEVETLQLSNESRISTESIGTGRGGSISLQVQNSTEMNTDSSITAETLNADGGNITLNTGNIIHLADSSVTTSVQGGTGDGGNINIDPNFVVLKNSSIIANAHGGDGGNIRIGADHFISDPYSIVKASSELGIDGTVNIESPESDISSSLAVLPGSFIDASKWIKTPCSLRTGEDVSRLVQIPRDAIPESPDDLIPSPILIPVSPVFQNLYRKGDFINIAKICKKIIMTLEPEKHPEKYADILMHLAFAFQKTGYHRQSFTILNSLYPLLEKLDDKPRIIAFYSILGDLCLSFGDMARPLPCLQKDAHETDSSPGNIELAVQYLEKGKSLAEKQDSPFLLSGILNNLANALTAGREYNEDSADFLKRGIVFARPSVHTTAEDSSDPEYLYNQCIETAEQSHDPVNAKAVQEIKAVSLVNTARTKAEKDDFPLMLEKALKQVESLPDSSLKASLLISAGLAAQKIRKHDDSIKTSALNSFSTAIKIAERFKNQRMLSLACGYTGQYHEKESRYEEALSFTRKALFYSQEAYAPDILYLWQWQTGRIFKKTGDRENALKAFESAGKTLDTIIHEFFSGYREQVNIFYTKVKPVYLDHADLLLGQTDAEVSSPANMDNMKKARDIFEHMKNMELQNYFQDECIAALHENALNPDKTFEHTAVIYPISFPDYLALLLNLPDGMKQVRVQVSAEELVEIAKKFRQRLQDTSNERYSFFGKKLFELLISPIESILTKQRIRTLIIAPDGILRNIPFSALQDSKRFLIEKYAVVIIPSITLTESKKTGHENTRTLLAGLSEARPGFSSLPNVPIELTSIRESTGGKILKDQDFTTASLKNEFMTKEYTSIHMATHAVFGKRGQDSFLLTYDDRLKTDKLKQIIGLGIFRKTPLDLLTLSACETALGDDRSALGLAGIALRAGARSAIATLWKIDDEAASVIVSEFYKQLKRPGMSKADAVRNSQKFMIKHPDFNHPAYWAPFLLIGNWR
ncbi:Filamentous hemagglutinin family N-terminal domain-containing protein, CHAT domain-containing [Desulfonema limicola]|uniref:Filamentous hemagglutinin family N-terminal domain-containing protein, CHAT domain-containing n=1 Tax=Desulfonema limicola TaxID=45656 RepID=A0A975GHX2_9BACT|nr:CHAT domain-containing protein [Desulfonema limicola]QTA81809.1 Filamentous hemagglutinin family N-terminal domain-containing protein, CHAT domain-containing [Desulfonema limicola]